MTIELGNFVGNLGSKGTTIQAREEIKGAIKGVINGEPKEQHFQSIHNKDYHQVLEALIVSKRKRCLHV